MPVSIDQFDQPGTALKCADCGAPLHNNFVCERCAPVDAASYAQPTECDLPVVHRNWAATLLWAVFCAASAVLGICALVDEVWIAGFFFLFLALCLMAPSVLSVSSNCPHCGARLTKVIGIGRCPHCSGFHLVRDARLHPIGKGFVAAVPAFNVPFNTLRLPTEWHWPWRGQCAVCRAPATREEIVRVFVPAELSKPVHVSRTTTVWDIPVDHCAQHRKGIEFDHSTNNVPQLKFRAWDHWRDFSYANRP
jgi:hypothetical protein